MGMQQLWAVVLIASVVLMTINHPLLMVVIGLGVFVYFKNPGNIKMRAANWWKRMTTKTPKNPNRRARLSDKNPPNKWN